MVYVGMVWTCNLSEIIPNKPLKAQLMIINHAQLIGMFTTWLWLFVSVCKTSLCGKALLRNEDEIEIILPFIWMLQKIIS